MEHVFLPNFYLSLLITLALNVLSYLKDGIAVRCANIFITDSILIKLYHEN